MTNQQIPFESDLSDRVVKIAKKIRDGTLNWGKINYSLGMLHSVWQATLCGYDRITVVELGVAHGNGLRALSTAAQWYQDQFDIKIDIVGFDTGQGLLKPQGYRDHPEMWDEGYFSGDEREIRQWLPANARLILGDVKDTIPEYVKTFDGSAPLAYVSIDVDYYSSTVSAFPLFEMQAKNYLPAMPVHVDDAHTIITFCPWAGESLALREFNDSYDLRKFEHKEAIWRIENFYVFHVLDHPFRSGEIRPPYRIDCSPI